MKEKIAICVLAAALVACLIVQWRQRQPGVPGRAAPLDAILREAGRQPGLAAAAVGFCLLDARGAVVLDHHARTAMIPASSLKTVTTATALEWLGPDFRFQTELRATVPIRDGTIGGDVIIAGGADPTLALQDMKEWAAHLRAAGLQRVTGRVVGDGRMLSGSVFDDFWNWGDIGNGYGSGVAGLNLEHNRYTATFRPAAMEGLPVEFVGVQPAVPGVRWVHEVITGAAGSGDGVVIHGGERTGIIHLRGAVPLGAGEFRVTGAVPDPELFAAHHLREALIAEGVRVEGGAATMHELSRDGSSPPEAGVVLLTHRSTDLTSLITSIHATSDNHETECLFRILGVRAGKAPDAVVREHWRTRGLEFEGLRMEDGCGLARADGIRPLDLARLQYLVMHGPHGTAYRDSLLSTDGGRLRWKAGAMSGVRSATGVICGDSGEQFCFALIINHYTDGDAVRELRDALVAAMRSL